MGTRPSEACTNHPCIHTDDDQSSKAGRIQVISTLSRYMKSAYLPVRNWFSHLESRAGKLAGQQVGGTYFEIKITRIYFYNNLKFCFVSQRKRFEKGKKINYSGERDRKLSSLTAFMKLWALTVVCLFLQIIFTRFETASQYQWCVCTRTCRWTRRGRPSCRWLVSTTCTYYTSM